MTAQAIAYSLFLAIPASLFVLIGVFSLVADETLIDELVERARTVMPEEATTLLRDSLQRTSGRRARGSCLRSWDWPRLMDDHLRGNDAHAGTDGRPTIETTSAASCESALSPWPSS